MTSKQRVVDLLALALVLGGCGDADVDEVPPDVLLERASAFRQACASQEIAATAQENLEMLESTTALMQQPDTIPGPGAPLSVAAVEFSRAYVRHAELRSTVYAFLDSAVKHAERSEDSTRYVQRANAFTIRPPDPGTVEANVIESFEENIIRILADDDHRCNWDIPALRPE